MAKTWLQQLAGRIGFRWLAKGLSFYPPYLGAGIHLVEIADDVRSLTVELRHGVATANFMGTQFGGSIYAMCDPWFMLMLNAALGDEYVVWDKAATVRFLRPGRSRLRATFELSEVRVAEIRHTLDTVGRCEAMFSVDVLDEAGGIVASVEKLLHSHKPSMKRV